MKKLLFALLLCAGFALPALGQSIPPTTWQEADGSPKITPPKTIIVPNGSISGKTVTLTGGGGGGCTPPGTANRVLYDNGAGGCTSSAAFTFSGAKITLGVAGSSVGAIGFNNATSGQITLQPVTGALGTVTLSLPAVTDTLVGLAATQTLTNKTLTTPIIAQISNTGTLTLPTSTDTLVGRATTDTLSNKTLASPSITGNISAEATSLLFFGGNYARYINTTGPAFYDVTTDKILTFNVQSLTDNRTVTWPDVAGNAALTTGALTSGNCAEFDASGRIVDSGGACGGSGGITVGTTTVTSGTATRLFYETAGNVVGQVSGVTSDGTNVTAGSGNLRATSPRITTSILDTNGNTLLGITATSSATEYITIANNTATNAVSLTASSPTVAASAQAGTPLNLTASPAIAGNVNVGAAAGGNVTITAGAAARLTSGNANGGDINLIGGVGIGTGTTGRINVSGTTSSFPAFFGATAGGVPATIFTEAGGGTTVRGIYANQLSITDSTSNATSASSFAVYNSNVSLPTGGSVFWSNNSRTTAGSNDLSLVRLAASVMRVGNGSTGAGSLVLGTSTVGSIGTSGVGVLAIANGTAPTSSPADEFQLYSADSAAGDANAFARNEAGEVNRLTGLAARNSSSFAKTSDTTLANITGLTRNVEAGRTYYFETELSTTSANTGGVKFAISGTATATAIDYEGVLRDGTTISAATRATALDTTVCAVTAVTAATCRIRGVIVVNAAGTLTVQFAQNASDGSASTVLVNQALSLRPIS